jgi:DNA-binding beta-propeller fold protein YncE
VAPLFGGAIYIYSPTTVPDVAVDPASSLTFDSAVFTGHVDPAGAGNITECHFEYVEEGLYRKPFSVSWEDATHVPCEANPPSGPPLTGPTDVSAQVSDLEPGHRYHLRLVATSASGTNIDVAPLLVTPGEYEFSRAIGSSGSGDGQFDEPQEVAFDDATGEIYVADTGNHRVVKLDASGDFVAAWGWGVSDGTAASQVCNGGCEAGTAGTNSPGESAHAVYVGDAAHGTVQKFTPSGDLIQAWGEGGEVDFSDEGQIKGITVSPVGDLFVATTDPPYMWTQLNASGLFRLQIPTEFTGLGRPGGGGIDVDPFGGFFQAQPAENEGSGGVYHRNLSNRVESNHSIYPPGYNSILKNTGLAVDREVSDVYVAQGTYIDQFKPHTGCFLGAIAAVQPVNLCPPDDTFGYGDLVDAAGLAFDPASKRLYAADRGADRIAVFERIPAPRITTGPPLDEGSPTEVSGHVEPAPGDVITGCRVEYGKTSDYELGDVPCGPGGQLSGATDVNAVIAGLDPLSTYHYRVVAEGSNGFPSRGEDRTFTVQGPRPSVGSSSASDVGPTQATLHATVNPESAPTVYRFEYGTSTDYESATPAGDSIGADASVHQVSSIVNGLEPGVTYHFRVVARNFNGPTFGPDQTFRTPSVQPDAGGVPSSGSPTPNPPTSAPKAKKKKSCKRGYVRKKGKCRKRKRGGRR